MTNIPQIVYDLFNDWGNDLQLSATKDLRNVNTIERGKQRILRRLLTSPGTYIFHPTYGAGIPALIGQPLTSDLLQQIKSLILSQIFLEPAVSQNPQPEIFLQTIQGGLFCQINYTDNPTQQQIVLTFNVGNSNVTTG